MGGGWEVVEGVNLFLEEEEVDVVRVSIVGSELSSLSSVMIMISPSESEESESEEEEEATDSSSSMAKSSITSSQRVPVVSSV